MTTVHRRQQVLDSTFNTRHINSKTTQLVVQLLEFSPLNYGRTELVMFSIIPFERVKPTFIHAVLHCAYQGQSNSLER